MPDKKIVKESEAVAPVKNKIEQQKAKQPYIPCKAQLENAVLIEPI